MDMRIELFWEPKGGRIVHQKRDMLIMSAVNVLINGKHIRQLANRLARTGRCRLSGGVRSPLWGGVS